MPKMTLLELTQDILNELESDEVNSITDTAEAFQVASIIKNTYYNMISNRNWPHLKKAITLNGTSDSTYPNYLLIPEDVQEVHWVKYDKRKVGETRKQYLDVSYLHPDEFIYKVNQRNNDDSNVVVVADYDGISLLIRNDIAPTYYTSFDDEKLVFDSYDNTVDSSMQGNKSQAFVTYQPVWTMDDTYVPDLPTDAFMELLEEAKSTAFIAIKQSANQKSEQKATRQRRWMSRKGWKAHGGIRYADYGRRGSYRKDPNFRDYD